MRKRYGRMGAGLAAAAALAALLLVPWDGSQNGRATAAEVLAQAVEALADLHSVYIRLNMRTSPRDNFEFIGLDYDFVSIEMWKRFSEPPQWRAEEPGRVVVMDGESTVGLIRPNQAYRQGFQPRFGAWMGGLMDVHEVLDSELQLARERGLDYCVTHENAVDGASQLVVSVEARAEGDYSNDWLKNKSITDSDHRRVYRFDAQTKLLEDLEVWVHADQGDVLVLEIEEIAYNQDLAADLFAVDLPEDVIWWVEPEILPDNVKYAHLSPDQAARAFLQACADRDWGEALKFWSTTDIDERMKHYLGGLKIISVGEPFQSGRYPGWFVPYQIKTRSGDVKKHNLAVRNDNPAGRYVVDGGI